MLRETVGHEYLIPFSIVFTISGFLILPLNLNDVFRLWFLCFWFPNLLFWKCIINLSLCDNIVSPAFFPVLFKILSSIFHLPYYISATFTILITGLIAQRMSGQIHLHTVILAGLIADGTRGLLMEKVIKAVERELGMEGVREKGGKEGKKEWKR